MEREDLISFMVILKNLFLVPIGDKSTKKVSMNANLYDPKVT